MGMMNEIFLQDAERHAAFSRSFMYVGPGSKETWKFVKYTDDPREEWEELARQVTDVYLVQEACDLEKIQKFQKKVN